MNGERQVAQTPRHEEPEARLDALTHRVIRAVQKYA